MPANKRRYRRASFDAVPAHTSSDGTPWHYEPRRNTWNRRHRTTTRGIPSVERTRERLQFLAGQLTWLKAVHEWQRAKVRVFDGAATRQRRQVDALRSQPAGANDLADARYALKHVLQAAKQERAELGRIQRSIDRHTARLAHTGQKLKQQKQRRAVTMELRLLPPNARTGFPGGPEYRNALARFARLTVSA